MDVEQEEMQFLGFFGILKQSINLIHTWRKIFTQITLTLILPAIFIFLAHMEISHILLFQLISNESSLLDTQRDSVRYRNLADVVTTEVIELLLFKLVYFTILLIFSLLSTSAVVYTVACAYTSRDISFKKVMSVVPRVWKRLMVTFLCMYIAMFVYNFCAVLLVILCDISFIGQGHWVTLVVVLLFLFMLYLVGLAYMSIIWQLASVVSVLEDSCGFRAMVKGKNLLKGKLVVPGFIFLVLNILAGVLERGFGLLVVNGREHGVFQRVVFGVLALLLLVGLLLFWLVVQTVIYFVCKSYHHENVDKSLLSDHLDRYLGEYVPLKARDVQLEHFYV